jgi:hypothetical protein
MKAVVWLFLAVLALLVGCAKPVSGIITMPDHRIWVIRGAEHVYRCAEAEDTGVPQPVCVRAEFVPR